MGWRFNISRVSEQARRRPGLTATCIILIGLTVWSLEGARILAALNPTLKRELALAQHPALDVWIAAPDYAAAAPMIISTPAGLRFEHETLTIAQGSSVSAHLAEQDGDAPELVVDGDSIPFTTDAHGDFAATAPLTGGHKLSIRRGWLTLASWKINIVADSPPKVALTDKPSITDSKTVRLSYSASDPFGVADVSLRITPHNPLPGANNKAVDIPLPIVADKQITRVDFEDLTARPWAGQQVTMQLIATNKAGKQASSESFDFTLPERSFFHPIARVLIEERRKLLQNPDDEKTRDEAANVMAGISHETGNYHGDPVVLMALRAGAVRLVLDHDHEAATSVNDLLWQAATRVEDGSAGSAQRMLRDARQDLANAVQHNAGRQEIELLTVYLQQALDHYMARINAHRASGHDLSQSKAGPEAQIDLMKIQ